jgi:DNA-binding NtrC family response regulator
MPADVLLVEDNVPEARLIEKIAASSSAPVRITTANDCSGALARLSDAQLTPRLVIADLGALEFRGVELLKRCNPRGIPVVVFSGSKNPADEALALRLGAKEFISKPTELDEYAKVVRGMISKWAAPQA